MRRYGIVNTVSYLLGAVRTCISFIKTFTEELVKVFFLDGPSRASVYPE